MQASEDIKHHRVYAENNPTKAAYIVVDKQGNESVVTYKDLENRSNQCCQLLREIGVNPKDKAAIILENHSRFLEIAAALQTAGVRYTLLSYHMTSIEIEYIVNDFKPKVIITSYKNRKIAEELLSKVDVPHRFMLDGVIDGYQSYEEEVKKRSIRPIPEDIEGQVILYSSGTTGRPKGIVRKYDDCQFGKIDNETKTTIQLFGLTGDTVYLSTGPLYHAAPLYFCMWTIRMGGSVVVMERYDSLKALSLVEKYKVTHSQWVPTMFVRLLGLSDEEKNKFDLSSMKIAVHAGAPCPIDVKEKMIEWWGPKILEYYSSSETYMITVITSGEWLKHKGSIGRCAPGKGIVHILDANEKELPKGEVGIIYVEGGNDFEYHNDDEKTKATISSRGWRTIGDLGYIDDEEYVFLAGRRDDLILVGGVNVYPREVEDALCTHPKVDDAAVIGIPNKEYGEEVKAIVKLATPSEGGKDLESELITYCRERLANFKCPRSVEFVEEMPRTETGKLKRRTFREK